MYKVTEYEFIDENKNSSLYTAGRFYYKRYSKKGDKIMFTTNTEHEVVIKVPRMSHINGAAETFIKGNFKRKRSLSFKNYREFKEYYCLKKSIGDGLNG